MSASPGDAFTVLDSAARSGKQTEKLVNGDGARGVTVFVDATASNGDGTEDLQVTISVIDPVSGKTVQLIQDTPFSNGATGTVAYLVSESGADSQTAYAATEDVPLTREWQIDVEVLQGGASPDYTYSVGANYHR